MMFTQRSPRARALHRLHRDASGFMERQAASARLTNQLGDWRGLHPDLVSLPSSRRLPLVCRAAILPAIVFFDALLVSQAGQALAQGMSGGNWYAGIAGLLGLPLVIALAELVFAHYAEEELRLTGRLALRTILLWILVSVIPVVSGFFAIQGIAAAFGADSEQKTLGLCGAALIAALHFCLILTAESIMAGIGYCMFTMRDARLTRRLRVAGTRLEQTRRAVQKSWLDYYDHLQVDGQPDLRGGPFSVAVTTALSEIFNLTIQQAGPAGGDSQQIAPNTHTPQAPPATDPAAQPKHEPTANEQTSEPQEPGPSPAQENLWNNITRRKAS